MGWSHLSRHAVVCCCFFFFSGKYHRCGFGHAQRCNTDTGLLVITETDRQIVKFIAASVISAAFPLAHSSAVHWSKYLVSVDRILFATCNQSHTAVGGQVSSLVKTHRKREALDQ